MRGSTFLIEEKSSKWLRSQQGHVRMSISRNHSQQHSAHTSDEQVESIIGWSTILQQITQVRSCEYSVLWTIMCVVFVRDVGAIFFIWLIADFGQFLGGRPGLRVFRGLPPFLVSNVLAHFALGCMLYPVKHSKSYMLIFLFSPFLCVQNTATGMTKVGGLNALFIICDIKAKCIS